MNDLRRLASWLQKDRWPIVSCPECSAGFLEMESLSSVNSGASDRYRDDPDWEPEWLVGTFNGLLRCNRHGCSEPVVIAGSYKVDYVLDDHGSWFGEYDSFYKLRYAVPAIRMIPAKPGVPEAVEKAILMASAILWEDPSSAGNRLRVAVEELMTAYGIPRMPVRNGRRVRLTTHSRIQEFKRYEPLAGETLEAVKWVGNQASHASELSVEDVLDTAEILEYALRLLYDRSDEELNKLVRRINRSKKLPKRKQQ